MFPLNKEQINNLKEEDIKTLCYLDSQGLLLGINEDFAEYKTRLLKIYDHIADINSEIRAKKVINIDSRIEIREEDQLLENKYAASSQELAEKYAFQINWIPVFFHKNIGALVGGYTLIESDLMLILISRKFKDTGKWLIYSSKEILSHELCHAARAPIQDSKFEEFFAYNLSISSIRKHLGNCFRSPLDSYLLLFPIVLLFFIQLYNIFFSNALNTCFFWCLIFIYPAFLFIRNLILNNTYKKATSYLKKLIFPTQNIVPILFRCNYGEIKKIAEFASDSDKAEEWFKGKISTELRWKVISERFFSQI